MVVGAQGVGGCHSSVSGTVVGTVGCGTDAGDASSACSSAASASRKLSGATGRGGGTVCLHALFSMSLSAPVTWGRDDTGSLGGSEVSLYCSAQDASWPRSNALNSTVPRSARAPASAPVLRKRAPPDGVCAGCAMLASAMADSEAAWAWPPALEPFPCPAMSDCISAPRPVQRGACDPSRDGAPRSPGASARPLPFEGSMTAVEMRWRIDNWSKLTVCRCCGLRS